MSPIKSAGWIIYYIDNKDKQPRFFVIKRHAMSWKIERVAPKGKIETWENPKQTVVREIWEEVWINLNNLKVKDFLWHALISLRSEDRWNFDKQISYYLVEYTWNFEDIKVADVEWYLWYHKWATIQEISWLIHYSNLRNIFMKAASIINSN